MALSLNFQYKKARFAGFLLGLGLGLEEARFTNLLDAPHAGAGFGRF